MDGCERDGFAEGRGGLGKSHGNKAKGESRKTALISRQKEFRWKSDVLQGKTVNKEQVEMGMISGCQRGVSLGGKDGSGERKG